MCISIWPACALCYNREKLRGMLYQDFVNTISVKISTCMVLSPSIYLIGIKKSWCNAFMGNHIASVESSYQLQPHKGAY